MAQHTERIFLASALVMALLIAGCADEDASSEASPNSSPGLTSNTNNEDVAPGTDADDAEDTESTDFEDTEIEEEPAPLPLEPSQSPPLALPPGATFYENIEYGADPELNAFDIIVPASDEPTPLIVYIHGGGFTGGDKQTLFNRYTSEIERWLSEGIAVATINYRLLLPGDDVGVHKPLGDSRYCLQFMRYHASSLNIDPEHIALFGGSAGAGTSLWLGASDDMAEPLADDPVERMSTRVSAVALFGTQGTYDIRRWETDVFIDFGITLELIAQAAPDLIPTMQAFYGLDELSAEETFAAFEEPEIIAYRASVDMLALLDFGDPPVWIQSSGAGARPSDIGGLYHHPNHGREVQEAAQAAGVEVFANLPNIDIVDEDFPSLEDFMLERLP